MALRSGAWNSITVPDVCLVFSVTTRGTVFVPFRKLIGTERREKVNRTGNWNQPRLIAVSSTAVSCPASTSGGPDGQPS